MYKLILLNVVCLFCVLTIGLADQNKAEPIDANQTASTNDKRPIVLEAKAVMKTPNARDLKQSESHVGILYPHHPHYHHGYHHHGYHHYPYHHLHHKYHHMHLHYPYYHHLHHLHHPFYHHHHYHGYPYPYYGYLHFSNIYGLNFSPLFNRPLYHLKPHLHHPTHLPHHFFPKPHFYSPHYPPYHYPPHYPHNHRPHRCECSKYAMMNSAKPPHHHLSKMKPPVHDLPIHSLNGHPINGHPLNRPHRLNGHAINGHATNGHSMPYERPHYKLNGYESRGDPHNDAPDKKPAKTLDKPAHGDFPRLPPNELMSQLVDVDTSYLLPKHGPAMQSVMQDRYRRLIYGQFLDGNLMSPSNYLYEPFLPADPSKTNARPPQKSKRASTSQAGRTTKKKPMKKEMEHLQLQNGGQMHLIKMGMIK